MLIGPSIEDADGDGLANIDELAFEPRLNPLEKDTDGDGLSDGDEVLIHHTKPHQPDSDGDGVDDRFELRLGSDPNASSETPTRDNTLEFYRGDLMVYLDFDDRALLDNRVPNHGNLGGSASLTGSRARIIPAAESPTRTPALELPNREAPLDERSYITSDYELRQIAIADEYAFTISFWCRANDIHHANLVSFGIGEPYRWLALDRSHQEAHSELRMIQDRHWGGVVVYASEPVADPLDWKHITWSSDKSYQKLYINGKLSIIHSHNSGILRPWKHLVFGVPNPSTGDPNQSTGHHFDGALDDLRVYRAVLPDWAVRLLAEPPSASEGQ